jgi:hypothetical protein
MKSMTEVRAGRPAPRGAVVSNPGPNRDVPSDVHGEPSFRRLYLTVEQFSHRNPAFTPPRTT